eukprot:6558133-Lingulodinium_polyedra.AAC.1
MELLTWQRCPGHLLQELQCGNELLHRVATMEQLPELLADWLFGLVALFELSQVGSQVPSAQTPRQL